MCGIAGVVDLTAPDATTLVRDQLGCLLHRGPDALGWYADGGTAVGQTRLSIIDLETGDPPVTSGDGQIGVALNGELYNFREVRARLQASGHRMATSGDTEVIAHLAEDLEPVEVARALDGMFAFAVWDRRRRRLVLGRDRLGKKPLYYWSDGTRLVFGSEIKAVLADPAVPRRLNSRVLPAYLTFGYAPTPETFYEGIRSVPPGHVLVFEAGGVPQLQQYWSLEVGRRLDVTLPTAATQVRELLTDAVRRRLVADVPVGAFLSGGVDSSAVVALLSTLVDDPVPTFTIGFEDDEGFDEREYARVVARQYRTDHHEFVVHPSAVDLVERLVWHHDQPFGDSSAIPTFLLAELTSQYVKVALSGDGGDELYAGYERFAAALALERYDRLPRALRTAVREGSARLPQTALRGRIGSLHRFARRSEVGLPGAFVSWLSYVDEERRARLLPGGSDWALRDYEAIWQRYAGGSRLDQLLATSMSTYLLDDLLVKVDRMSMAHGLEVRSPFLDVALVEHALRLPDSTRISRLTLKRVLKEAVSDLLPKEIVHRRKRGFGVPLARWFRHDLSSYVSATLGAPDARVRQHLVGEEVDRLRGEHRAGVADHGHALWALLTLEVFLRREGW